MVSCPASPGNSCKWPHNCTMENYGSGIEPIQNHESRYDMLYDVILAYTIGSIIVGVTLAIGYAVVGEP